MSLILNGLDKRGCAPEAFLASRGEYRLRYAGGGAFLPLRALRGSPTRSARPLGRRARSHSCASEAGRQWVKPELAVGIRHLRGANALGHATVQRYRAARQLNSANHGRRVFSPPVEPRPAPQTPDASGSYPCHCASTPEAFPHFFLLLRLFLGAASMPRTATLMDPTLFVFSCDATPARPAISAAKSRSFPVSEARQLIFL